MIDLATLRAAFAHLSDCERGATAIEYGMIAAGIGAFIAATVWNLGSQIKTTLYDQLLSLMRVWLYS